MKRKLSFLLALLTMTFCAFSYGDIVSPSIMPGQIIAGTLEESEILSENGVTRVFLFIRLGDQDLTDRIQIRAQLTFDGADVALGAALSNKSGQHISVGKDLSGNRITIRFD